MVKVAAAVAATSETAKHHENCINMFLFFKGKECMIL